MRVSSFLILVAMCSSAWAQTSFTVGDGSGDPGTTVNISVNVTNAGGVDNVQFDVVADPAAGIASIDASGCTPTAAFGQCDPLGAEPTTVRFVASNGPGTAIVDQMHTLVYTLAAGATGTIDLQVNCTEPTVDCTVDNGVITVTGTPAEGINLTPDPLENLDVADGGTATLTATVSSLTADAATITEINILNDAGGVFSDAGTGSCSTAGATTECTVNVACTPTPEGTTNTAVLEVLATVGGNPVPRATTDLACRDPLPLVPTPQTDPTAVDFGNVPVDTTSAPRQVVVSNAVDGTDFQITAVGTTSDQVPNVFGFDVGTCINNITIGDTGGSDAANCAITVTCSPVAEGTAYTGNLNIGTTAGNLQVPLQCGGVVAAPVPIPTLSQYAMMLLAGLMVMGAAVTLRRSA